MTRAYNFSAGPAMLPESVLQQAAREMMDWHGSGMSVMEMSHRGRDFAAILAKAEQDVRELLAVPEHYRILFLQGGATALNAIVPLNLLGRNPSAIVHVLHTGTWSGKAFKEAQKYASVHLAASSEASGFDHIPPREAWSILKDAAYLHICTNETIHGVEFHALPEVKDIPVVADMSSHILSRPVDVSQYGVIYAGAQKNLGLAGLTLLIVREDLMGHALPMCPSVYDWRNMAQEHSLFNTPPTYAIYMCGLMLQWVREQGGVAELEKRNMAKAACLYDFLDSSDFYVNRVRKDCRSRMNIPFFLRNPLLDEVFLKEAQANALLQLQGHRLTGGMRASLYNAMPIAGVQKLVEFMRDFALRHA